MSIRDRFGRLRHLLFITFAGDGRGNVAPHLMAIPEAGFLAGAIVVGAPVQSGTVGRPRP